MLFSYTGICTFLCCLLLGGCKSGKKVSIATEARPSIYKAWEARYNYDLSNRSMIAKHQGEVIGRAWSRDVRGKINQFSYTSPSEEMGEDLLPKYNAKIDQKRDSSWELAKQKRVEYLEGIEELMRQDEEDSLIEIDLMNFDEEEDSFDASGFIPQGLGLDSLDSSEEDNPSNDDTDEGTGLDQPFLSLP